MKMALGGQQFALPLVQHHASLSLWHLQTSTSPRVKA